METNTVGHLCFLFGLVIAVTVFILTFIYVLEKTFLNMVIVGVFSLVVGYVLSMRLANFLDNINYGG
jgi:hypothetical protein